MPKEKLFSITANDCEWDYFRGSGKGGQHRNKKDTCVRCTHRLSGAVGEGKEYKSQKQNKRAAFKRMANSKEFNNWVKREVARISGAEDAARRYAEREVNSDRIKVEVKQNGKWIKDKEGL